MGKYSVVCEADEFVRVGDGSAYGRCDRLRVLRLET
jgi:hypothetical protein